VLKSTNTALAKVMQRLRRSADYERPSNPKLSARLEWLIELVFLAESPNLKERAQAFAESFNNE